MQQERPKRIDHRSEVAAQRRAEMEVRLFSAALLLLAKKNTNEISINDLIEQANVSRGTFYKYFHSLNQVFLTLTAKLDDDLAPITDRLIVSIPDAATRVATGTRLLLTVGCRMPLIGKLMVQSGWPVNPAATKFLGHLARDIQLAMTQGVFEDIHAAVAANMIIGPMLGGLQTMLLGPPIPGYAEQLTLRILLSLGMSRRAADEAILVPIPELTWQPSGLFGEVLKMGSLG